MPESFPTVLEDANGIPRGLNWVVAFFTWIAVVTAAAFLTPKHASDLVTSLIGAIIPTLIAAGGIYLMDAKLKRKGFEPAGNATIGDDGVHLLEHGVKEFVHFSEMTGAVWTGGSCRLVKRDGSFLTMRPIEEAPFRELLEDKRAQYASRTKVRVAISCGPKEGETASAWSARLASRDDHAYRGASLSRDDLLRIAETPTSPRLERVGATLALKDAPEPIRAKVRIAIGALADRDLAAAMENALEGEVQEAVLTWSTERDGEASATA